MNRQRDDDTETTTTHDQETDGGDAAGTGYPASTPAEAHASDRDAARVAGDDGSEAVDRAVGAAGREDGTDPSRDTETRELLTTDPPRNRRAAP